MRKLFIWACVSVFVLGWRFSFYIDTDRQTRLTIGMDQRCTSGFDREIDKVAPPLPPEGSHSFFPIKDEKYSFIEGLWEDIRGIADSAKWKVITLNLEKDITLLWDPDSLPDGDILYNDTLSLRQFPTGKLNIGLAKSFTLTYRSKTVPSRIASETELQFELENPSPNPFNTTTNINFNLPAGKHYVSLRIIDITGKVVRELFSGMLDGGKYRIIWDGKDNDRGTLSSGLYFVTITKDTEKLTKRLVLLK